MLPPQDRSARDRFLTLIVGMVVVVWCSLAAAVEPALSVRISRPPHYVGEAMKVEVQVVGWEGEEAPVGKLAAVAPDGLEVTFLGSNANRQESVEIRNGVVRRSSTTTWIVIFQVASSKPGKFTVGPLEIRQGTESAKTETFDVEFQAMPVDSGMDVELELPDRSFYVGERVEGTLVWRFSGDLERLADLLIQIDPTPEIELRPSATTGSNEALPIRIGDSATMKMPATRRMEEKGGQRWLEFRGQMELLAKSTGVVEVPGPVAIATRVVAGDTDPLSRFFGGGVRTARTRVEGPSVRREIKALPVANRPGSFAGAVGSDYAMEVQLSRSVVHVGDPLSVEITLRGPSFAALRLPDLASAPELPRERFQVPETDVAGDVDSDAGTKKFRLTVRIKDANVQEFPALAYSWFDPTLEQYVTAHSQPIALRVLASELVSAAEVESNRPAPNSSPPQPTLKPSSTQPSTTDDAKVEPTTPPSLASRLQGADLAYMSEAAELGPVTWAIPFLTNVVCYTGGTCMLGWALLGRRWSRRVHRTTSGDVASERLRQSLESATSLDSRAAARGLAQALQRWGREAYPGEPARIAELLADLEREAYQPEGSASAIDPRLIERIRALMQEAARQVKS